MGVPAYYGRPALVAGYARQSAPASVQVVVVFQVLGGLLSLACAALVGAVAGRLVSWPDARWPEVAVPGPEVRQAVAERGPAIAIALALIGLVLLALAGSLRRGRQWSRVLVLMVSAVSIAATLYGVYRGQQVNIVAGLTIPVIVVLALCTRSARSWFRWGNY